MTLRRRLLPATVVALAICAGLAATAEALHLQAGDIVVEAEGGFAPQALPRHESAPITLHGGGSISTASASCHRS